MTSDTVRQLLRGRYDAPEWALLYEVRNRTGYGREERFADAVAMNLWPSRGLAVHGFEIKVSRSDWLAEMRNPAKSAAVQKFCDYWWLVVGDKDIIQPGELPETWGLYVVEGKEKLRLVCRKEAPKLKAEPLNRLFIASMLRRAAEVVEAYEKNRVESEEHRRGWEEGHKAGLESRDWQKKHLEQDNEALKRSISLFEEASGVKIDQWNAPNIGRAVKLVLHHSHKPMDYANAIKQAMRPLEVLLKAMGALSRTFELIAEEETDGRYYS